MPWGTSLVAGHEARTVLYMWRPCICVVLTALPYMYRWVKEVLAQKAAETPESGVVIAEVDVSENPLTSKRFSITGLPTLAFIADGRVYEYRRKRTIAEMLAWARGVHRAVKTHVQFGFSQVNTRKTTGRTLLHHKAGYR